MTRAYRLGVVAALALAACASEPETAAETGTTPASEAGTPARAADAPASGGPDAPTSSDASIPAAGAPGGGASASSSPGRGSGGDAASPAGRTGGGAASGGGASETGARSAADAQDEGARILRAASAAYEKIRSLQADFVMTMNNPLLRTSTTSRGRLSQRQPDRILLEFTQPAGDIIVGDGTHFWIYYPSTDAKQAIRAPAAQGKSGGVDLQAQFVGDPVTRFAYTLHGQEPVGGRQANVLTLRPKADAGYTSLKVWIDTRDSLVRRFEITEENGAVRRFDLSDLRVNPTLPDALFRFEPPAGVRVVERN